jgi:hypothetical protein
MATKECPGMTTDQTNALRDELEDVREAWSRWTDVWQAYQRTLRAAGYSTARLEAYQVGMGTDEGGGQSMEGWLAEIESDLMESADESVDAE